jgi:pimeloyl-ACP methyl ester carboxylesterase
MAAAKLKNISAVVSRGGRPDLVMKSLPSVICPTLFIVGSLDQDVLALNKIAYDELNCVKNLEIVEGASHLFEEPGKMDLVCTIATNWFEQYMEPIKMHNS